MKDISEILSVFTCLLVLLGMCGCKSSRCPCTPAPKAAALTAPVPVAPVKRQLADFEGKITKTLTMAAAQEMWGKPDSITGRKMVIYVYKLDDGRELRMGFLPGTPLQYAKIQTADGKLTDLELK